MPRPDPSDVEPAPLASLAPFEEGDFHALTEPLARDPQYDDRRLVARRKLGAIAKLAVERLVREARASGGELDVASRTSLHRPHTFNHMRVRRLWAYVCRGKQEKARLKRVVGAELAKDLDAAYRNAYLSVALEPDALEVGLVIHPEAWYDGQNLLHRVTRGAQREGLTAWVALLNALEGFRVRLDDWKGEWICGRLDRDRASELLRYYRPGERALRIERRWPAPAGARGPALAPDVPRALVEELARLGPLYRFTAWSRESDFLFAEKP
jgi:hypothetical protein